LRLLVSLSLNEAKVEFVDQTLVRQEYLVLKMRILFLNVYLLGFVALFYWLYFPLEYAHIGTS